MNALEFSEKAAALLRSPVEHTRLCAMFINAYWQRRGYDVNARVDYAQVKRTDRFSSESQNIPVVVSDLVCGLPVGWTGTKVEPRR